MIQLPNDFWDLFSGKQCYEVDECYEENVGTEEVFSKEIKLLISGLFGGQNSAVFCIWTSRKWQDLHHLA